MNRWRVVVGGVSMNLALGSLYAWSVFVAPLEKEFGWTRAQTSLVYTIAIVCFALSFMVAGRIQDLKGPKICAAIGGVLVSAGFFLASWTNSLAGLYLCLGVIVGLGNGFGYATPMPVASKWFPDKRGLVVGLMVAGYGAGSAILGPLATRLIATLGWRPTVQILGCDAATPGPVHAFLTSGAQGINLRRGAWHGVLTPLQAPGLFAVVDRIGEGTNLEEYPLPKPVWVTP